MSLSIVILAAGLGRRMHSKLPKVLHGLAGKPILEHVVQTALKLNSSQPPLVVYGYQGEKVRQRLSHLNVTWIEQKEPLGTGDALKQALPSIPADHQVLVLYGDVPLISFETLTQLMTQTPPAALGMITAYFPEPTGLGRVLRDTHHKIIRVIEEKDANATQQAIKEINSGIYLIPAGCLHQWLPQLNNQNVQKEYYLTDIIPIAVREKKVIQDWQPAQYEEVLGVNDHVQLAQLERIYQKQIAEKLMRQGTTLYDPNRFDVRGELTVGEDVVIDVNVIVEGRVVIGNGCIIGPHTILRDTVLGERVEIKAHSLVDGAIIAEGSSVGPFARIRPGSKLASGVHIGNFVEIKNSLIGTGTKINHLTYIGDSEIGKQVNIGAGTITCNYDGANKHKTIIGDNAFVGSNVELVAPVTIGEGATIGAGSTITRNAPPDQLTLCRAEQRSLAHWQRPKKLEKEKEK